MTDTTLAPRAPRAPKHGAVWALMLTTEAPLHHGAFGGDAGNAVLHRRVPLAQAPDLPGVSVILLTVPMWTLSGWGMADSFLNGW